MTQLNIRHLSFHGEESFQRFWSYFGTFPKQFLIQFSFFSFTQREPQKYWEGVKKWLEANIPESAMLYPLLGDIYPSLGTSISLLVLVFLFCFVDFFLVCENTPETVKLELHERHETLFNLLAKIIQLANGKDNFTIISLDDVQWFDRLSWTLLVHLIEVCSPKARGFN